MDGQGAKDLTSTVGNAGIVRPPFGSIPESAINTYGEWAWGSRDVPPFDMYMFDVGLVARTLVADGPFFALNHAGHGVNSYGLNLVTVAGPMAVFVQHCYGGVYNDPMKDLIAINTTYTRISVLFQAEKVQKDLPIKWLLVYSQFRGAYDILSLDRVRSGSAERDAYPPIAEKTETALFRAAAERFGGLDFFNSRQISW